MAHASDIDFSSCTWQGHGLQFWIYGWASFRPCFPLLHARCSKPRSTLPYILRMLMKLTHGHGPETDRKQLTLSHLSTDRPFHSASEQRPTYPNNARAGQEEAYPLSGHSGHDVALPPPGGTPGGGRASDAISRGHRPGLEERGRRRITRV